MRVDIVLETTERVYRMLKIVRWGLGVLETINRVY